VSGDLSRDRRNMRRFLLWTFLGAVAHVGAALLVRHRSALPAAMPWLAIVAAALVYAFAVRCYLVYLRETDELKRRIEIESLAVGFGVGAVLGLVAPLAVKLSVTWLDSSVICTVMLFAWAIASVVGYRRYSGPAA
jgi:predicted ABC-type exoprotein transport system permease subunit